jgi:hypothetical protein
MRLKEFIRFEGSLKTIKGVSESGGNLSRFKQVQRRSIEPKTFKRVLARFETIEGRGFKNDSRRSKEILKRVRGVFGKIS